MRFRPQALAALVLLAAAATARNFPHLAPGAFNWAETGNVATALEQGRGFSDPFAGGTGPTAWIPPLPVWIEAAVFAVAGVKTAASAAVLLALAVAGLAGAHALIVAAGSRDGPGSRAYRTVAGATFLVLMIFLPGGPFEVQSEAWLDLLLAALLLWAALAHEAEPSRGTAAALVAGAVLGPLTHAGLALATLLVLAALAWRARRRNRPVGALAVAAGAAALALGGWTARNSAALHRLVPLKSNGWFEFHLANVASPDGLLRAETALRALPFFDQAEFDRYASAGEMAYVDSFRAPSLAALRAHPGHIAANVLRRLQNALVFCRREDGSEITRTPFAAGDFVRLVRSGELLPLGPGHLACWTRIDQPPAQAAARLASLGLADFRTAWRDWTEKRSAYDADYRSPKALAFGFLVAGAPVVALLGAALGGRGRWPARAGWAAFIAAAMLLPYIAINHGLRHQIPVLGLAAALFGACAEAWAARRAAPAGP